MIYDYGRWDVKAGDNVVEGKLGDLNSSGYDKGDYFNPLSEIVCSYYNSLMSFKR